ncbi:MAG TPA: hypothetical protein DD392_02520, partial [Ruminococcus sp.]|nr:hypothetical protein [Ruminococcus sp.]
MDNLGKFKAVSEIHYNDVKVTKINGNLDKYGNNLEGYINISKSAVNGSLTDSYPFTIIFSGASFSSSYLTKKYIKEITFKDKIPDGMELDTSVNPVLTESSEDNKLNQNGGKATVTINEENGYLVFKIELNSENYDSFKKTFENGGGYLAIHYSLKAKDENSLKQNEKYENTVEDVNIIYKDGTEFKKEEMHEYDSPSADVTIKEISPAPGFAKKAYKSFAGQEFDSNTVLNNAGEGLITAGDTLIWQAIVYNGGSAGQTADLSDYSITDTLPSNYSYDDVTGYPVNAWICDFNENGGYNTQSGTKVDVPNPVKSGNTVTWSFTGDNYKLAPGKCLVLEFSTVSKTDLEGVITNSGYAEINQNFTDEDVIAGNKQDNKIYNYANYNIVGLTTESWKTITYENQGHTGVPHTDPETDTGNSRNTTHNYVQGVQGEKVTYTINVTNNSPVSIENFTVIDRLPYVNDKGLVSGYERNSAFGVQFSEILSVKVGDITIESSKYQLSFSTDKTSVLNEYSGDWSGKNDVMTWTSDSTNAINFRVLIDSSVKVKPNETVVITFKGIVPSYVEKTGISNIAWNSFAYAYQNTEILGDTVMVAEPAKVGVWVETPATANKIIINKTVENSTGGTFWFALFKDGTTTGSYERISDMVSVQLAENSTTGNVTMDNLDFASIKEVNQADNIYLFETTEKGDILTNQNSVYSPSYTTGNTIDTSKTENIVDVTNTKETGSISFTKTVVGNDGVTDTFWFGLFTKQGNEFIRYEDAGIKSAVIKGNGSEKVTFSDIPNNSTFYVFETNENGVIVDTLEKGVQTLYTGSQNGEKYLVNNTGSDGVKAGEEFTVTNTKQVNYQITVNKILLSDDVKASQVFYVGLYDSETATKTDIVKSFTSETEAVFTYLDGSKTYYIAECDKDGNRYDSTFTQFVYLNNSENPIERTFTVTYENNTVSFADDSEQYVSVTNTDTSRKTGIIINKNIISAAQPT